MTTSALQFDSAFQALTEHSPLRWQRRLFERLRCGEIPDVCDLPTGLGKTSVIPIWTIALARQAQDGAVTLPRRLVYIVNRRTVVDQATSVVERIRQRLLAPDGPTWSRHAETLRALGATLQGLTSTRAECLAVSTLRGELADNEEWKADPARPAIIVGTIDMVGSKLLFSGYGDGRYWRAQHAGLLGQDALIVHDEAHLTPAFSDLLHQCAEVQRRAGEPRPIRVMELSATSRNGRTPVFRLESEDEQDQVVLSRLDALKLLRLHKADDGLQGKPTEGARRAMQKVVELSLQHEDAQARVLLYVRSPEVAQKVVAELEDRLGKQERSRIALLTGTIRGQERDRLVSESPVFRAFLDPITPIDQTVYLVSTSAGEVGADIDADHGVCDSTTLDSIIQRLGRINRRGGPGRKAQVDVVLSMLDQSKDHSPSEIEEAISSTEAILTDWAGRSNGTIDASLRGLRALLDNLAEKLREKAFAPKPPTLALSDILLDAWSLTTVNQDMPGRPEVAAYLHGLTRDPPETFVAWRQEVALLHESEVDRDSLADWFQACRIEARERLRDRTDRVKKMLGELLKARRRTDECADFPVVLLNERGEADWSRLSRIVDREFKLAYRTVVLPAEVGGLNEHGALDPNALAAATDVADREQPGQRRQRWLLSEGRGGPRYERLVRSEASEVPQPGLRERERMVLHLPEEGADEDGDARYLVLLAEQSQSAIERAETASTRQTLPVHLDRIAGDMNRISQALGLDGELSEALELAARWHDRGKSRPVWQRYACNDDLVTPLAKSTRYLHGRALGGYRHELGSLLEATADSQIGNHPRRDLILHLIAAHHGWGRPHFEANAWDNTHSTAENEDAVAEAMRRFGHLQQHFGRWGLAWLEALVRCADIAASIPGDDSAATSTPREGHP